MKQLMVLDHALVKCQLTILRDRRTDAAHFRDAIRRLTQILTCEASRGLPLRDVEIDTPIARCGGHALALRIGLVPILRAGLGMVESMLELIPGAEVWHLGLYRDEQTAQPVRYYSKLRPDAPVQLAFVLDPMLATGGSAALACQTLKEWGAKQVKILSVIAAPAGINHVHSRFPDVDIFTCVVDQGLNADKFIVPGLGDAGDRIFNTLS
jgi:uracil phosphoribosyltransferase